MGVGNAYHGVKALLINRNVKARITGVIKFVPTRQKPGLLPSQV